MGREWEGKTQSKRKMEEAEGKKEKEDKRRREGGEVKNGIGRIKEKRKR